MKLHEILEGSKPEEQFLQYHEIDWWLEIHGYKEKATVRDDLSIDYDGSVEVSRQSLKQVSNGRVFPIQFNEINGSFNATGCHLTVLRGAPRRVNGIFSISRNRLRSLNGGPVHVGRHFDCSINHLTSLRNAPEYIGQSMTCYNNPEMRSLHNIHKQIKHIGEHIGISPRIESNILGLMLIKQLSDIEIMPQSPFIGDLSSAVDIINKHLKGDRNIHECQEELIEAGLKEFARL